MHRSAEAAVEAGGTCEDLCKCTVKKEVDRKLLDVSACVHVLLDNVQNRTAEELLHYIVKLLVIELMDGGKSLCKDLSVASV